MPYRAGVIVLGGLLMIAFAGCATAGPGAAPTGVPAGAIDVEAAWLDGGRMIAVVVPGSAVCAPIASEVEVADDGALAVLLEDAEGVPCATDSGPRAVGVAVPEGIDPAGELRVRVTYGIDSRGETDLDGYAGADVAEYTPSAGWVDDGLFAILTWGSSSCAPVVESVEATATDAVAVTFATPPADRMCTMDMAPRIALVSVDGVGGSATLMLAGGSDFPEPVTVPIEG